jgi:hypothetical protein
LIYVPSEDKVFLKKTVTEQPSPYVTSVTTYLFDVNTGNPYHAPSANVECQIVRINSIKGTLLIEHDKPRMEFTVITSENCPDRNYHSYIGTYDSCDKCGLSH